MAEATERTTVRVDDRTLTLTSLEKVLYPGDGTTKAEALHYVATVAPALLAQLRGRPVTRVRWPHGTADASFFEKNVPAGTPAWVPTVTIESPGSTRGHDRVVYPLVEEVATLMWLTNLSALELHAPQWRVDEHGQPLAPDRLVVDLDPGSPAGLAECAQVAVLARDALLDAGATACVPVTSGSKGMQLYAPAAGLVDPGDVDATRALAESLAQRLSAEHPRLVVSKMLTSLRRGKVLLDWSQNTRAKTTISPYSLRGKLLVCTVAAPRRWEEIEAAAQGDTALTQLGPDEVIARLEAEGDLMAALDD